MKKLLYNRRRLCYNCKVRDGTVDFAGIAQLVEQLIRNEQVACSSHVSSSTRQQNRLTCRFYGGVAHLGERYIRIVEVRSSSLPVSTIKKRQFSKEDCRFSFCCENTSRKRRFRFPKSGRKRRCFYDFGFLMDGIIPALTAIFGNHRPNSSKDSRCRPADRSNYTHPVRIDRWYSG